MDLDLVTTTPGQAGAAGPPPHPGMVWIPGGEFSMGSEDFYPEEAPVRRVHVDGFWMDQAPGHRLGLPAVHKGHQVRDYGGAPARPRAVPRRRPAPSWSLVCSSSARSSGPVPLDDIHNWWEYVPGASWRRTGRQGDHDELDASHHPVVQVALEDVENYGSWAVKELPTEAEWEFAARGGLEGATFAWGDEHFPEGKAMANSWQGEFPWQNLMVDGFEGTSPVGSFPASGYGLYDITGNVWEWTSDWYSQKQPVEV